MYMLRNQPYYSCPSLNANGSTVYKELKHITDCRVVGHVQEEYRQHGVVLVYLDKVCVHTYVRTWYIEIT